MTPLPLLAAVLVAGAVLVVVPLAVLLVRRRRTPAVPAGPRTVAELVEMRAVAAPARVTGPAPPEPEPAGADVPEDAVPAPVLAPPPVPVAVAPAAPAGPVTPPGDDVPWRRAALITGANAGLAEPRPAAAGPVRPTAAVAVRAVAVPAPLAGSTRRDVRNAVPARSAPVVAERPAVVAPVVDPPRSGSSVLGTPVLEPVAEPPVAVSPVLVPIVPEFTVSEPTVSEFSVPGSSVGEPAEAGAVPAGPDVGPEPAAAVPTTGPPVVELVPAERPAVEPSVDEPAAVLSPTAEQAAADLALLRTFGAVDLASRPDRAPDVALASAARPEPEPEPGAAQPVRFRVVGRDGEPIAQAAVALLDAGGRETAAACGPTGELTAPRPGSYVLVATATGHQAGALALGVADAPVQAELLLVRSALLRGLVTGEDGPVPGARVTLVQDGEVVETADGDGDGAYRVEGLAAGEYAVSVAAAGCEPHVELVLLPDEAEVVHDVELAPAGVAAGRGGDGG